MNKIYEYSAPAGRVLIAVIFLMAGIDKIGGFEQTGQYMAAMGVPAFLLIPTILLEVGGALAVIVGWKAREAAGLLAIFSISTAVLFHANFQDQMQMIMLMKNFAIAGGLLMIVAHGPGSFALDKK